MTDEVLTLQRLTVTAGIWRFMAIKQKISLAYKRLDEK